MHVLAIHVITMARVRLRIENTCLAALSKSRDYVFLRFCVYMFKKSYTLIAYVIVMVIVFLKTKVLPIILRQKNIARTYY